MIVVCEVLDLLENFQYQITLILNLIQIISQFTKIHTIICKQSISQMTHQFNPSYALLSDLPSSPILSSYNNFKHNLLQKMITCDPLSILQSQIFQNFQQNLITHLSSSSNKQTALKPKQILDTNQLIYQMQSKITMYSIDNVRVNVVQKRSHSCDGHKQYGRSIRNEERILRNRLRKEQEQRNVDLVVFSNIMNNHFNSHWKHKYCDEGQIFQGKQNVQIYQNTLKNQKLQTNQYLNQSSTPTKNQLASSTLLEQSQLEQLIEKMSKQILINPSKSKIKFVMRQLLVRIQQENDKIIEQLNRIRKQNDRLNKSLQESSLKQLQFIVQIKHLEKKNIEKEEEIHRIGEKLRNIQQELRDREGEYTRNIKNKIREIDQLQNMNSKKSYIEELKQKLAIDSIRRTTLRSLNREKFQIQLQKQQLAITANSSHGNSNKSEHSILVSSFIDNEFNSQQTRDDDQ